MEISSNALTMSAFLVKALVSQCQDIERTLDMFCWPSLSWPEIENVEALGLFIKELVFKSHSSPDVFNRLITKERFVCKVQSIIWDHCVPLLKMISSENIISREESGAQGGERKQLLQATCALLMICVKECQMDSMENIAGFVLPVLSGKGDSNGDAQLDVDVAIEVLAELLSGVSTNSVLVKNSLSCTLCTVKELSDTLVSKIIVRIWFTCLKSSSKETQEDILCYLWGNLLEWYEQEGTEVVTARLLLCLTALSDFLFSLEQRGTSPEKSHTFFKVVQNGLVHKDNMSRKRALYLLNRCVSLAEARNADINMCDTGTFFPFWIFFGVNYS